MVILDYFEILLHVPEFQGTIRTKPGFSDLILIFTLSRALSHKCSPWHKDHNDLTSFALSSFFRRQWAIITYVIKTAYELRPLTE